jgi:hypothetical protein
MLGSMQQELRCEQSGGSQAERFDRYCGRRRVPGAACSRRGELGRLGGVECSCYVSHCVCEILPNRRLAVTSTRYPRVRVRVRLNMKHNTFPLAIAIIHTKRTGFLAKCARLLSCKTSWCRSAAPENGPRGDLHNAHGAPTLQGAYRDLVRRSTVSHYIDTMQGRSSTLLISSAKSRSARVGLWWRSQLHTAHPAAMCPRSACTPTRSSPRPAVH